jgi:hypothetical protein
VSRRINLRESRVAELSCEIGKEVDKSIRYMRDDGEWMVFRL